MRIMKVENNDNGTENVIISEHFYTAGHLAQLHWHDYYELEIILDGSGTHTINDKTYEVVKGSAYLLTMQDVHIILAKTDLKILNVCIVRPSIDDSFASLLTKGEINRTHVFTDSELTQFIERLNYIEKLSLINADYARLLKKNLVEELVIRITTDEKSVKIDGKPDNVQKCVDIINRDFMLDISIESVAEKLFLSPNYLGWAFKKALNVTFREYLNEVRLKYARNLLLSTDLQLKEVAAYSGFNSVEYFSAVFKNKTKESPAKFRQLRKVQTKDSLARGVKR